MNPALTHIKTTFDLIENTIKEDIIGQDDLIKKMIIALFAGGHTLIEGVPGLGKTKTIRSFAKVLDFEYKRISFTPDLLPSDLTGVEIYKPAKGEFEIRKGPIFTNILLADEINRTPPKVQSALLEAMEENQVSIGDTTFLLPEPFIVFATQNPLEHEGTYPLPEAQLDRFFMKICLQYPTPDDERKILIHETTPHTQKNSIITMTKEEFCEMQRYITTSVRTDEKIYQYITELLGALRGEIFGENATLSYGPSSRAGLALIRGARIHALMDERDYIMPEDIKALAHEILDHRMGISYLAHTEGLQTSDITEKILDSVRIP